MTDLSAAKKLLEDKPSSQGFLRLRNLTKHFGSGEEKVTAVDSVNLDIHPGEFVTLLGPSGCGKTTTLRMIAGFEDPSLGEVLLDDVNMIETPPNRRPMAMVFQSYALFPHLKVRDNVAYGLRIRRTATEKLNQEVSLALESMNLQQFADRAPNQLSGGQQQRVALARAMVMKPKVLLFDEPLSNLDAKLRERMRLEIRNLQQQLGITSVYVTHDQAEAMSMSDRIIVMNSGRVEQAATPDEIYRRPASVFVADFIGRANFLEVDQRTAAGSDRVRIEVLGRKVDIPAHPDALVADEVVMLLRPESVRLRAVQGRNDEHTGRVQSSVFYGDHVEYEIQTENGSLVAVVSDPNLSDIHKEGDHVEIDFNSERAWLLPAEHESES